MQAETQRIWNNRNRNGFLTALSFFGLFYSIRGLFTALQHLDYFPLICEFIAIFASGFLIIRCSGLASKADAELWSQRDETAPCVEDRLDELERLKRRNMVTSEEYAAKRQDILNDL